MRSLRVVASAGAGATGNSMTGSRSSGSGNLRLTASDHADQQETGKRQARVAADDMAGDGIKGSAPVRKMAGAGSRRAMAEALTIRVRRERDCPIVTVAGEIDIATVTRLRERLFELAAGGRPLIADLDQVSFIDSAGLGALVAAATRAAAHGGSLQVVCARPQVRQLFRLTGLDRRIPLARTLDGVLASLAAARDTPR